MLNCFTEITEVGSPTPVLVDCQMDSSLFCQSHKLATILQVKDTCNLELVQVIKKAGG